MYIPSLYSTASKHAKQHLIHTVSVLRVQLHSCPLEVLNRVRFVVYRISLLELLTYWVAMDQLDPHGYPNILECATQVVSCHCKIGRAWQECRRWIRRVKVSAQQS